MIMKIPAISWEFKYILRILSLWPNTYNIFIGIILWLAWITIIPFQIIHMSDISDDAVELMTAICDFSTEIALYSKLLSAWINRKILMELIIEMDNDWQQMEVEVTRETRISCFVSRLDLYLYCGTITMFFPKLMISYFTDIPENREFLLKTSYPFDDYKTPFYEIIISMHLIQGLVMTSADLMPQALIVALICHCGVQFNILQHQIKKFIEIVNGNELDDIKMNLMIEKLVKKHYKNINFAEKIEKVFSVISCIHCLSNGVSIGCSGLVFVMSRNPLDICRFSLYLTMKLLQTFILCYAGEYLTNKSTVVADVIYESNWYKLNRSSMKNLQLMIIRAQKPLQLTAGKFAVLSSEMFTVILKTSGSYLSVLRATY